VFGRGSIYGLRSVVVIDATETRNQTLTLGAAYKRFDESVTVGGNAGFSTPIHYLPLSVNYSAALTDKQGTWQAGAGLVVAVRGLASRQEQFADKRFNAQSNFSYLTFDIARSESLPWGLSVFGKLEGQLSEQALISNEQFVAGGVDSVRGYLEAAAVGDKALRGTLELRSPKLARESASWFGSLRIHAFAEGAGLWLNSPLPGQQSRFGLLGVGLGLRLQARDDASLALDLGWPLRDAGVTRKGEPRLHASGTFEFW
jgi:hemolysin activation/secretion protein